MRFQSLNRNSIQKEGESRLGFWLLFTPKIPFRWKKFSDKSIISVPIV